MVWPTLGSRTAKGQDRTGMCICVCMHACIVSLCWFITAVLVVVIVFRVVADDD